MDNILNDFSNMYTIDDNKFSEKIDDILIQNEPISDFLSMPMLDDSSSGDLDRIDDDDDEYNLIKIKEEALLLNESEEIDDFDINDYIKTEVRLDLGINNESNDSKKFYVTEEEIEIIHDSNFAEEIYDLNVENSMDAVKPIESTTGKHFEDIDVDDFGGLIMNDHNYMSQDIISQYDNKMTVKGLKNNAENLQKFLNNYKASTESEMKSLEIIKIVDDIEITLKKLKNEIKSDLLKIQDQEISENVIRVENGLDESLINNTQHLSVDVDNKSCSINVRSSGSIKNDKLDGINNGKSIDLENALNKKDNEKSEDTITYKDKELQADELIKTLTVSNKNEQTDNEKLILLEDFGKTLIESCNEHKSNKKYLKDEDFVKDKIKEVQNFLRSINKNTEQSTQAECVGNLLDYINAEEKKRLLDDFSESSDGLDLETDNSDSDSSNYANSNNSTERVRGKKIFEASDTESKDSSADTIQKNKIKEKSVNEVKNKENCADKEIDRLLNFKSLANKKELDYVPRTKNTEKNVVSKTNKIESLIDILEENKCEETGSDDSQNEMEELPTEKDFLLRTNEDLKKQMLQSSSDSEDEVSSIDLPDQSDGDSNTSLVDKFLETYAANDENDENDMNDNINVKEIISNELSNSNSDKENNVNNNSDDISDSKNIENNENELLDKSFSKIIDKKKTFEILLKEDEKRRKINSKPNEDHISLSSDEESDLSSTETPPINRTLRPIMRQDQLASETKVAQKEETQRISRLKKKEEILKKAYKEHKIDKSDINTLILDYNTKTKKFIKVQSELLEKLKQHQIDGVKFMYDCCYGSVNFLNDHPGSGCILAHCMGLGKTLQLITLLHTVIVHKELNTSKILVLCPKSTVMNWSDEILYWLGPLRTKNLKLYSFSDSYDVKQKLNVLKDWAKSGNISKDTCGCLLIGYEAFRSLVSYHNYKKRSANLNQADVDEIQRIVKSTLLDPGADLVICDEGHIIKNRRAAISQAVQEIKTPRRIILTGTPIQNNLREYYSMVNFIKPSYLGTEKEFANLYANPIKNGQHKDSSKRDIKIMKQRSFVLHKKLSTFVQRREAALLKTFLPQKFEYVLFIPMSDVQTNLYEIFLDSVDKRNDDKAKGRNLLTDYTCLRKIWTHPKVLENAYQNAINLKQKKDIKKSNNAVIQSDDEEPDDVYDSQIGLMSVTNDWWRTHLTKSDLETVLPSNKLQTMFQILKMCEEKKEKCLIFSAFVAVLNVVEYFMQVSNNNNNLNFKDLGIERLKGQWVNGQDYYRLDGKTPKSLRHEMIKKFNNVDHQRARVFLISAKAGGQGINLIGANRVIILDTSWNPSNDNQNIFRIFRLGQKKSCFVYRLISMGTMEEKVYSRSVTKQAMSFRVVDEQQIDRHYSMAELAELYALTTPLYSERPVPSLPQDNVLANLLRNHPNLVYKYHEHDSLLENKIEQELSEQEKEDAWQAYEQDIVRSEASNFPGLANFDFLGGSPFPQNFFLDPAFMSNPADLNLWQNLNHPFPNINSGNNYLDAYNLYKNSIYGVDHTNSNIHKQMESNYLTRHLAGAQNFPSTSQLRNLSSLNDLTNNSNPNNFLGYNPSYGHNMLGASMMGNNMMGNNIQGFLDSFSDAKNSLESRRNLVNPNNFLDTLQKNNKRNDPYSMQMRNLENNAILEQNKNLSNRNVNLDLLNINNSIAGPSTSVIRQGQGLMKNSDKSDSLKSNKNINSQSDLNPLKIANISSAETIKNIDSGIEKNVPGGFKMNMNSINGNTRKRPRSTSPIVINDVIETPKKLQTGKSSLASNEVYEVD